MVHTNALLRLPNPNPTSTPMASYASQITHVHLSPTLHKDQIPTPPRNPNYHGKHPRPYYPPPTTSQPQLKSTIPPIKYKLCKKLDHTAATCPFRNHPPRTSNSSSHPKTAQLSYHHTQPTSCPPPTTHTPPHRATLLSPHPHLTFTTTPHCPSPTPQCNPNYKGKNPRPYYPPSHPPQPHPLSTPPPSSSHLKIAYLSGHHTQPTTYPSPPPTYTSTSPTPESWLLDSGATAHLTNQLQHLHIPHPYTGHDSITVGNGSQLPITHTGHHTIITPNGKFNLPELLYVPTLKHNLLSVFQLTSQNNCKITFDSHGFYIHDNTTNQLLHQGTATNGLYPITSSSTFAYSATPPPTNWHARLGHPHSDVLHHLSKHTDGISSSRTLSSCNACGISKSHKLSFHSSFIKTSIPFE